MCVSSCISSGKRYFLRPLSLDSFLNKYRIIIVAKKVVTLMTQSGTSESSGSLGNFLCISRFQEQTDPSDYEGQEESDNANVLIAGGFGGRLAPFLPGMLDSDSDPPLGFDLTYPTDQINIDRISSQLEYVNPIADLVCPICQIPFNVPTTTICGHTFCHACLDLALEQLSPKCPMDRTPLDKTDVNDVFPAPLIINNLLGALSVKCLNFERGCVWEGKKNEVVQHLRECGYTRVRCNGIRLEIDATEVEESTRKTLPDTHEICEVLTEQRFLTLGTHTCAHRPYECIYCHAVINEIIKNSHLQEHCEEYLQKCVTCDKFIPLKDHAAHMANECESKYAQCPAENLGCDWRSDTSHGGDSLEAHVHSCVLCKLSMSPFMKEQQTKMEKFERENHRLISMNSNIVSSIISGKLSRGFLELDEVTADYPVIQRDVKPELPFDNHFLYEIDRVRLEFEQLRLLPAQLNESMMMISQLHNENLVVKNELAVQRNISNSLRRQMLLFASSRNSFSVNMPMGMASGYSSNSDDENSEGNILGQNTVRKTCAPRLDGLSLWAVDDARREYIRYSVIQSASKTTSRLSVNHNNRIIFAILILWPKSWKITLTSHNPSLNTLPESLMIRHKFDDLYDRVLRRPMFFAFVGLIVGSTVLLIISIPGTIRDGENDDLKSSKRGTVKKEEVRDLWQKLYEKYKKDKLLVTAEELRFLTTYSKKKPDKEDVFVV
ncbi:hypothetical protein BABINDRAFT_175308 [Babjeviella inositovora NRRL Y-12698]|uniref:RING-type domain-containing protein n=1 Tax=Babjeviella inositovora NRRL Y-12698 TaxID=984486 RepID=A0A1E3QSF2_9ASCO|nr:uncharacterized protein BABINDRAFT_175308 [Babjeviella inositovora NRRL Y-12698]ODQ80633.1 hypothetical protein BABINDRAFT_175308 [Babjeviella inositovora NRRL Y-12698]